MSADCPISQRYGGDQPAQASGIGETTDKQFKKPTQVVGQAPVVEGDALKETGPFDNIGAKPDVRLLSSGLRSSSPGSSPTLFNLCSAAWSLLPFLPARTSPSTAA